MTPTWQGKPNQAIVLLDTDISEMIKTTAMIHVELKEGNNVKNTTDLNLNKLI